MHLGVAHIVAQARAHDYVLLLNDDLVFSPNLVEELVQAAARHPRTLIQAVESCVSDPGVIWQGGVSVNWWTAKHRRLNHLRRTSEFPTGHFEISAYLTARGVLVPMDVFAEVGNYDTRLTQCGDGEFTRRAAKHGYQLIVHYGATVLSYDKGQNFNETDSYTPRDARRYYFGVLSNARVAYRWRQALSMTNSTAQALVFMGFDLIRITVYFVRRLRKPALSPVR
jgi:GT2 family glycosyltransferase